MAVLVRVCLIFGLLMVGAWPRAVVAGPPTCETAATAVSIERHDGLGVWTMRLDNGVVLRMRSETPEAWIRADIPFRMVAFLSGTAHLDDASGMAAISAWEELGASFELDPVTNASSRAWMRRLDMTLVVEPAPDGVRVVISGTTIAGVELAARLLAGMLSAPKLEAEAIEAWRAKQLAWARGGDDDAGVVLRRAIDRATAPKGVRLYGPRDAESIEGVDVVSAQTWLDGWLASAPIEVTVAGLENHRYAFDPLRAYLRVVEPRSSPDPERLGRRLTRPKGPIEIVARSGDGPALCVIGFHAPDGSDVRDTARQDEVRRLVLAHLILKERLGPTLLDAGVRVELETEYDPRGGRMATGLVWVLAVGAAGSTEASSAAMWAAVERLASEGPTEAELASAVEAFLAPRREADEGKRADYWARILAAAEARGVSFDHSAELESWLEAVTVGDVRDALRAWTAESRRFTVRVEPE